MKYRKLTAGGDYTFGQSASNFHIDIEAVRQAIQTRLQLYRETFWRDLSQGVPMFQQILGNPGSASNLAAIDSTLQSQIKGTEGVSAVLAVSSSFNEITRAYDFTATVQTQYSTISVSGVL